MLSPSSLSSRTAAAELASCPVASLGVYGTCSSAPAPIPWRGDSLPESLPPRGELPTPSLEFWPRVDAVDRGEAARAPPAGAPPPRSSSMGCASEAPPKPAAAGGAACRPEPGLLPEVGREPGREPCREPAGRAESEPDWRCRGACFPISKIPEAEPA